MKTKILVSIIALVIIIGGGWYAWKMRHTSPTSLNNEPVNYIPITETANTATTSGQNSSSKNPTVTATPQDAILKAQAMKVIDRPINFGPAISASSQKTLTEKINSYKDTIRKNYNSDEPWLMLGSYYKAAGDYNGAIAMWDFLAFMRPKGYLAFHNLGSLYGFELHNYAKSEENFLKAIQNEPKDFDAYSQMVTVYRAYKPEKIEAFLLSGITANPNETSLKILLGEYYASINKKTEALKYLQDALRLNPSSKTLQDEIKSLQS